MFAEGLLNLIRGQGGALPSSYAPQAPGSVGGYLDYAQPLQALPGTMAAMPPGLLEMLMQGGNYAPPTAPAAAPAPDAPAAAPQTTQQQNPFMKFANLSNENGVGYGILGNGERMRLDSLQPGSWEMSRNDIPYGHW